MTYQGGGSTESQDEVGLGTRSESRLPHLNCEAVGKSPDLSEPLGQHL